jgi:hypothetical protein
VIVLELAMRKRRSTLSANLLDARAAAGSVQASRRRAAMIAQAQGLGLPATSATSAALMLGDKQDLCSALRLDIDEVRQVIAEDQWPVEVMVTGADGEQVLVRLPTSAEAALLLDELEARLHGLSDKSLSLVMLQTLMQKRSQTIQILSNISKKQQETAKSIIQNMR